MSLWCVFKKKKCHVTVVTVEDGNYTTHNASAHLYPESIDGLAAHDGYELPWSRWMWRGWKLCRPALTGTRQAAVRFLFQASKLRLGMNRLFMVEPAAASLTILWCNGSHKPSSSCQQTKLRTATVILY